MSARSFRPVIAVATVATAALGCYLVSLRVATERASLEDVETRIVLAQRDIRTLQTEIGTRGRLEQLERWNVKVLALSAPKADQFLDGGYQLARLARPSDEIKLDTPVVMASAPKPQATLPTVERDDGDLPAGAAPAPTPPAPRLDRRNDGPASLVHVASFKLSEPLQERSQPKAVAAKPKLMTAKDAKATDPLAPRAVAEKSLMTPATTKTPKIATVLTKQSLPAPAKPSKAEPKHEPVKAGATKAFGTH